MGFSSPLQDVRSYSASRPPLVIFVMCLFLFACATLAMAFYVQYADVVLNPEIRLNWKKFLSRLGSLDLCAFVEEHSSEDEVNAMSQFIDGGNYTSSSDGTVSITVAASLFLMREFRKYPQGMVAVSGTVKVNGSFSEGDDYDSSLNVTFIIPKNLTETKFRDTCVILTGPSWLLPLGRRSNVCIPSSINRTITHVGTLIPLKQNDTANICRSGSSVRLSYNNHVDDEFYLSKEERWNVYIRLIHASYILFISGVIIMCYSLVRGRTYSSIVKIDKMPLTL